MESMLGTIRSVKRKLGMRSVGMISEIPDV